MKHKLAQYSLMLQALKIIKKLREKSVVNCISVNAKNSNSNNQSNFKNKINSKPSITPQIK